MDEPLTHCTVPSTDPSLAAVQATSRLGLHAAVSHH